MIDIMDEKITIYVCTHKNFSQIKKNNLYSPLFVGAINKKDIDLNFYKTDDQGDNISEKNPEYNELTGLYWMWKNSESDIIGLAHYRRYLKRNFFGDLLNKEDIKTYLSNHDVIVPKHASFCEGSYYKFAVYRKKYKSDSVHVIDYLPQVKNAMTKVCPEYVEAYEKFLNDNKTYTACMFVTRKEIMDKYCEWLFSLLNQLEIELDYKNNRDKYSRLFGGLAENLFGFWLLYNNYKLKECYLKRLDMKYSWAVSFDEDFFGRRLEHFFLKHQNLRDWLKSIKI